MPRIVPLVILLALGSLPALMGQEAGTRPRIATVTAGIGNTMGWLGVQGERYFAHERLSAFLVSVTHPSWIKTIHPGPRSPSVAAPSLQG